MTTEAKVKKVKQKVINAVDLFCGAGGSSTGLVQAVNSLGFDISLLAVNHWDIAIATHTKNHADAEHRCQSIDTLQPELLIPGKRLQLLLASPECTHHSNARGGKPRSDQKRADAWLLMRWIEKLYIENIIIENVKEFKNWGPLRADGKPDKRYSGMYFKQFIETLRINYEVDMQVLNAADFGDATTRERLFIIARRPKGKKIVWPVPSHANRKNLEKHSRFHKKELKSWRPAREIIDWNLEGKSIYNRNKPLSENTLKRIYAGLFKYSLKPFIMGTGGPTGQQAPRSVDEPMRTILTDGRQNLFVPYLINMKGTERRMRSVDEPTFTQTTSPCQQYLAEPFLIGTGGAKGQQPPTDINEPMRSITGTPTFALIEPFITKYFGNGENVNSIDEPVSTLTAKDRLALCEPFLVSFHGGKDAEKRNYSMEDPIPTIDCSNRFGVAEPYIFNMEHQGDGVSQEKHESLCYETERPLPTVAGKGMFGLIEPYLVKYYGGADAVSVDEPIPTITANYEHYGLAEPFLVRLKNNQGAESIDDLLKTLTTKECYGLCIPEIGAILDIRFRMLQPHELAAAMGFPEDYHFVGNREAKVKQIGNAVCVNLAKALCKAVLES